MEKCKTFNEVLERNVHPEWTQMSTQSGHFGKVYLLTRARAKFLRENQEVLKSEILLLLGLWKITLLARHLRMDKHCRMIPDATLANVTHLNTPRTAPRNVFVCPYVSARF